MESTILQTAAQQGLWALLFISLYFYQLRESGRRENESKDREDKLTSFLIEISKQFEGLVKQYENIAQDVQDIKLEIHEAQKPK